MGKCSEITHREVGDMEEPAWKNLVQMEDENHRLTEGHYRMIVGDDASGRLFGKIFAKVIGGVHTLMNIPPPALVFCTGHPKRTDRFYGIMTGFVTQKLKEIIETDRLPDMRREIPRPIQPGLSHPQILVTTDGIQSGSSLIPALRACKEYDIGMEAAAIRIWYTREYPRTEFANTKLYDGNGERSIYQRYDLLGVQKDLGVDLVSKRYQSDGSADTIRSARQDVDTIADRLLKKFAKKYGLKKTLDIS